jgi:cob(I)alamin adenosyltransferase
VDELNSILGLAQTHPMPEEISNKLRRIQNELFSVGADLASPWQDRKSSVGQKIARVSDDFVETLESEIDESEQKLKPLSQFILPGGSEGAARLHLARTVCRRAERVVAGLVRSDQANPKIGVYLNRLSDWLFVMARSANHQAGIVDLSWSPGKP